MRTETESVIDDLAAVAFEPAEVVPGVVEGVVSDDCTFFGI